MELSFYFVFESTNFGSLAKFHLIYRSVKTLFAHYFSPAAFPRMKMLPEEATSPERRSWAKGKTTVFLEQ